MHSHPRIVVGREDHERLSRLIDQHQSGRIALLAEQLESELSRAELRDVAPPDVVALNRTVIFEDEGSGERREGTLCLPQHVAQHPDGISVLAPVGCALLGLAVNQCIEWDVPGGRKRLRILSVRERSRSVDAATV